MKTCQQGGNVNGFEGHWNGKNTSLLPLFHAWRLPVAQDWMGCTGALTLITVLTWEFGYHCNPSTLEFPRHGQPEWCKEFAFHEGLHNHPRPQHSHDPNTATSYFSSFVFSIPRARILSFKATSPVSTHTTHIQQGTSTNPVSLISVAIGVCASEQPLTLSHFTFLDAHLKTNTT